MIKESIIHSLRTNRKSGLAVSVVSLCLSIPLALASGAAPLQGIIAAMRGGLCAAIWGGSRYNIIGPAGALTGLLFTFVLSHGSHLLPLLTICVGLWIFLFSWLKISTAITSIPSPVLHGFMIGVGITILLTQLNNALGLVDLPQHMHLIPNLIETIMHRSSINAVSLGIFLFGLGFLVVRKKMGWNIPGVLPLSLFGIIGGYVANGSPGLVLLASQFPELHFSLWTGWFTSLTSWTDLHMWYVVLTSSFVIAAVALLETIISAKIADQKTQTQHHQGNEIRGLVRANVVNGIFGGMPVTGVFLRTALNIEAGAQSSWSQGINAVCIMIIAFFGFQYFTYIPVAIVAAILIHLAWGMIRTPHFFDLRNRDRFARGIMCTVALVTVLYDPMYGILAGTSISLLSFLSKAKNGQARVIVFRQGIFYNKLLLATYKKNPDANDCLIIKIPDSLSFLNVSTLRDELRSLPNTYVILSFSQVYSLDIDGNDLITSYLMMMKNKGREVRITGAIGGVEHYVQQYVIQGLISVDHIFSSTAQALNQITLFSCPV
ncbi:MAG: SulP family inorganic anion transporter [Candidatus Absconditabacterales bacterium]|nr:SulP family inorganic anion transporter [Candidatus Absconditabacterales bacterium]